MLNLRLFEGDLGRLVEELIENEDGTKAVSQPVLGVVLSSLAFALFLKRVLKTGLTEQARAKLAFG